MKIKVHTRDDHTTTVDTDGLHGLGEHFLTNVNGTWYEVKDLRHGPGPNEAEVWCGEPFDLERFARGED